jgi:tetratricopeptide (TPR) repeat protein
MQPTNANWWNYRCWDRAILGRLEAALTDCNEALRLKPNDSNTLDSRGLTYLKLGQLEKAIADYDAALKTDPKLAGSLYGRGVAKLKKGDSSGAADISAAKAIKSGIAEEYAKYGVK